MPIDNLCFTTDNVALLFSFWRSLCCKNTPDNISAPIMNTEELSEMLALRQAFCSKRLITLPTCLCRNYNDFQIYTETWKCCCRASYFFGKKGEQVKSNGGPFEQFLRCTCRCWCWNILHGKGLMGRLLYGHPNGPHPVKINLKIQLQSVIMHSDYELIKVEYKTIYKQMYSL